ncbi:hypothetical protein [Streptomyces sp. NTK 937]|uniref:hypothetical protein n=1 Tax=Streptomyces sp. NTK 937 TaxID=1487711 RepID=UPI0004A93C01|nr:hypothetical protein [Streptomyces sp. NTK 937]KDQ65744.1 hypothetical protein DT87_00365 [Streptomyces sp. NTK 937]
MNAYGNDVGEPYAEGGIVTLPVVEFRDPDSWLHSSMTPDEARLLGLRLIKLADEAEEQEW